MYKIFVKLLKYVSNFCTNSTMQYDCNRTVLYTLLKCTLMVLSIAAVVTVRFGWSRSASQSSTSYSQSARCTRRRCIRRARAAACSRRRATRPTSWSPCCCPPTDRRSTGSCAAARSSASSTTSTCIGHSTEVRVHSTRIISPDSIGMTIVFTWLELLLLFVFCIMFCNLCAHQWNCDNHK